MVDKIHTSYNVSDNDINCVHLVVIRAVKASVPSVSRQSPLKTTC